MQTLELISFTVGLMVTGPNFKHDYDVALAIPPCNVSMLDALGR
jgi:hypothetical protein